MNSEIVAAWRCCMQEVALLSRIWRGIAADRLVERRSQVISSSRGFGELPV